MLLDEVSSCHLIHSVTNGDLLIPVGTEVLVCTSSQETQSIKRQIRMVRHTICYNLGNGCGLF